MNTSNIIFYSDGSVELESNSFDSYLDKTYKIEDSFFKRLKKNILKGNITEFKEERGEYSYIEISSGQRYIIDKNNLGEIEKDILSNFKSLCNSYEIQEKAQKNLEKSATKFSTSKKVFKRYYLESLYKVTGKDDDWGFEGGSIAKIAAIFINAILDATFLFAGLVEGSLLEGLMLALGFSSIYAAVYLGAIPGVMSIIKTGEEISNSKYKLTLEEYKKLKKKTKIKKSSKVNKWNRTRQILKDVEEKDIPTLEEQIIKDLKEVSSMISKIDNKNLQVEKANSLLKELQEYKKEEKANEENSNINLDLVLKQTKSIKFSMFLDNLKRDLRTELNRQGIDRDIIDIENQLKNQIIDKVDDDLSNDGTYTLKKKF